MKTGITGRADTVVSPDKTAVNMKSGDLNVFATPAVVALIEQACFESVASYIEEGSSTVGVYMEINHIAATPPDKKVWAVSTLTEVDGRNLTFEAEAWDEDKCIAKAVHKRVIIDCARFLGKLN